MLAIGRRWFCWLLGISILAETLKANTHRISEDNYANSFQETVVPFWQAGESRMIEGQDGLRLYTWHRLHPAARGQILISHGYAENNLKYRELAYNFFAEGYSVFILDHRGHGYSDRVGPQRHAVDVARFSDYSDDFQRFYAAMPLDKTKPIFLFGHSMGGAITIDFLEKHPDAVQAAAFSAPLFDAQVAGLPKFLVFGVSRLLSWFHGAEKFSFGESRAAPESWTFARAGTRSQARFELFKRDALAEDLRVAGPSNRWTLSVLQEAPLLGAEERVARLKMPIFIALAGKDKLVKPEPIRQFCRKAAHCRLEEFPESFHEIWNERDEIRNVWLDQVLAFYQSGEKKE